MKSQKFLIIFVFLFCQSLAHAIDRMATDEISSTYRISKIDPVVLIVPKDIQKGLMNEPNIYLKQLVDFLITDTDDKFLKVKRIHDWITDNIAYDNDFFYGKNKKSDTLKDKRTTCGGYSKLFKDMVELAGIEVIEISGKSRETFDSTINEMAGHVWNAVKIENQWYIVDTTHDSRYSFTDGKLNNKSEYRDTNLFISSYAKIINNFPNDPKNQFLTEQVSYEEFLSFPLLNTYWFVRSNIHFVTDLNKIIKKEKIPTIGNRYYKLNDTITIRDNIQTIVLEVPEDVSVYAGLLDSNGKKLDSYSFSYREDNKAVCMFSAPSKGKFSAYISTRLNPIDKLFNKIFSFDLISEIDKGIELPPPYQFYTFDNLKRYGITIIEHNLTDKDTISYFLKVKYPKNINVFSTVWDEKDNKLNSSTTSSETNADIDFNTVVYKYSINLKGNYFIKLRVKNESEKLYNETAAIIKIVK